MLFETSEIFKALKERSIETPAKTLEIISSKKEDIHVLSPKEETYFHYIAHAYKSDDDQAIFNPVVFQLSNAGLDVNATDDDGNSALHVAAKNPGARRLIRILIIIGADPTLENNANQKPIAMAKACPENMKIIKFLSPGMYHAVAENNKEMMDRLIANWCKITPLMVKMAEENENAEMAKVLNLRENTVTCVHAALAGDRASLRPILKSGNLNIHSLTTSYIDKTSEEYQIIPMVCEAALYGLDAVVRKLCRKKANPRVTVCKKPFYVYLLENMLNEKPFYDVLNYLLDTVDFKDTPHDVHAILDLAYARKVPLYVLQTMSANGLDLFAVDDDGHFLRDRILIRNVDMAPLLLAKETDFVDSIVLDFAKSGAVDLLKE